MQLMRILRLLVLFSPVLLVQYQQLIAACTYSGKHTSGKASQILNMDSRIVNCSSENPEVSMIRQVLEVLRLLPLFTCAAKGLDNLSRIQGLR